MNFQSNLFENICNRCFQFIAEYDILCDGCANNEAYAMCLFCEQHGFKDYSDAVDKIGREKVDELFKNENWLKQVPIKTN